MKVLQTETLTLEAGAEHLERLLEREAPALSGLPSALQRRMASAEVSTSLSALFPGGSLYEAWKYTPLPFLRTPWQLAEATLDTTSPLSIKPLPIEMKALSDSPALGTLPPPRSPWEKLIPLSATHNGALTLHESGFYALAVQTALPLSVTPLFYTIYVPSGVQAEVWLHTAIHPDSLNLLRLHVHVASGAQLTLYHGTADTHQGNLLFILSGHAEKEARFAFYSLPGHYRWVRTESTIDLAGSGAEALLYGAHITHAGEVNDTAIRVAHLAPHTHSNQLFRSLAHKGGQRIFLGRIYVARAAQKTNAYQSHKALLWEDGAEVYSRPQLEIFADDVRCTHGVTTGFLQGEMLFYLRARGLPYDLARRLVAEGFLMEALSTLPHQVVQLHAQAQLALTL